MMEAAAPEWAVGWAADRGFLGDEIGLGAARRRGVLVLNVVDGVVRVVNDGTPLVAVVRVDQELADLHGRLMDIAEDAAHRLTAGGSGGGT
jgi:hypothetical protein